MGKLLLAFAAGVVVASFAFVFFGAQSQRVESSSAFVRDAILDAPSIEATTVADESPRARSSEAVSDSTEVPESLARCALGDWMEETAPDFLSACTDDDLQSIERRAREIVESMGEMERVLTLVRDELGRRETIAFWAAAPPDVPIILPSEFNYLSESPHHFHEVLQRDAIDANWSPQMETQLRSFFASRPEITNKFGFPTINCRTSGCEIAFASYTLTPEQGPLVDFEFPDAVLGVYDQPWATQLRRSHEEANLANANVFPGFQDDGPQTILWYVWRAGADLSEFSPR